MFRLWLRQRVQIRKLSAELDLVNRIADELDYELSKVSPKKR
jgi:hypothetical protein